jgi:hypothetical protein
MPKFFNVAVLGLAAGCLSLVTPATSSAQNFSVQFGYSKGGYGPYGPNTNVGIGYSNYGHNGHNHGNGYGNGNGNGYGYGYGTGYANGYGNGNGNGYGPTYTLPPSGYNSGYGNGYGNGINIDDCYYGGGIIVQPTHHHWTPGKGYHSHGNIIVPHKDHFHVHKY